MPKDSKQAWFCARESGMSYYPVTWQGYVVMGGYVALICLSAFAIKRSWLLFFGLAFAISILLMVVVSAKSDDSSL